MEELKFQLVALAGLEGAGKEVAAEVLHRFGYVTLSLTERVPKWLDDPGVACPGLSQQAQHLRSLHGSDVLARWGTADVESDSFWVVPSVHNVAEMQWIRRWQPSSLLLWLESEPEVRMRRLAARGDSVAAFQALWPEFGSPEMSKDAYERLVCLRARADACLDASAGEEELEPALKAIVTATLKTS